MRKNVLFKSMIREVYSSPSRFFSIFAIILLGVGFFAGISATGPDMLATVNRYYQDTKLMDVAVSSNQGLSSAEIARLEKIEGIKATESIRTQDAITGKSGEIIHLMSFNQKQTINKYEVVKGRLPKNVNEIAIDNVKKFTESYQIGDYISISKDNIKQVKSQLAVKKYKVVGYVNSPLYIERISRGSTYIGKGTIDGFGVISPEAFTGDYQSTLFMTFRNVKGLSGYSDAYDQKINKHVADLENVTANLSNDQLKKQQQAVIANLKVLSTQISQLTTLNQQGLLSSTQQQQLATLTNQKATLTVQQAKLVKPTYIVTTRGDNTGYSEYEQNGDRISAIATVFPVFFFLIAALVCLTTMTRMIEEQRIQIGTMKALGYSNAEISLKYFFYAAFSSLLGTIGGLAIGYKLFPNVIYNAYGSLYNTPELFSTWYFSTSIISLLVALLCTVVSALFVLRVELRSEPAVLMLPKAPKAGKRILLERWHWLWGKFNFMYKVTARNVFRYKSRMLMTVFGIAGCMGLIVTGFGVKDSISNIVDLQYSKIFNYQSVVAWNPTATDAEISQFKTTLADMKEITHSLDVAQSSADVTMGDQANQSLTIMTPASVSSFKKFVTLDQRKSGQAVSLAKAQAVITEKLASLYNLSIGDQLTFTQNDKKYHVKVGGITENYAGHFLYLTPTAYQKIFNTKPDYNITLLDYARKSTTWEDKLATKLSKTGGVANTSFMHVSSDSFSETMGSLNVVIIVLIVAAAALAFVVLYNLTNINVSERIRELSTIKVLGFYDREVTMYIYRENFVLTILGIIAGCFFGLFLHRFVLNTAELDIVMFVPELYWRSYVLGALFTIAFSTMVMWVMHLKLKHVDMIEALKAND